MRIKSNNRKAENLKRKRITEEDKTMKKWNKNILKRKRTITVNRIKKNFKGKKPTREIKVGKKRESKKKTTDTDKK